MRMTRNKQSSTQFYLTDRSIRIEAMVLLLRYLQASDMTETTDISEQSDIPLMNNVEHPPNNSSTL